MPAISIQGALWGPARGHPGGAARVPGNPGTSSKKPWVTATGYILIVGPRTAQIFSKWELCQPQKRHSRFGVAEIEATHGVFGATLSLPIRLHLHTLPRFLSGGSG